MKAIIIAAAVFAILLVGRSQDIFPAALMAEQSPNNGNFVVPLWAMNYMPFSNSVAGTVLTPAIVTNSIIPWSEQVAVQFSENGVGRFQVSSSNAPSFQVPLEIGTNLFYGNEAHVIQVTNDIEYATLEFDLPSGEPFYQMAVSGFFMLPPLPMTPATYDLVVVSASQTNSPYSTEDLTLQVSCGAATNYVNFEDDQAGSTNGGVTIKTGHFQFTPDHWYYFTSSMDVLGLTNHITVYDAATWAVMSTWSYVMPVTGTSIIYWEFGNNEVGTAPGLCTYFSGFNWTNSIPPYVPPYTYPSNQLVLQMQFNGNLDDSSPNAWNTSEFGGSYDYVSGENSAADGAISVNDCTINNAATNALYAITINYWINYSTGGMPFAGTEFTSWYTFVDGAGIGQFDLLTSSGHINMTSTGSFLSGWHMFTATWDSAGDNHLRIYRDGVLDSTSSGTLTGTIEPLGYPITIGSGSTGYAIVGDLDDVRLYGRALNASEISQIYAAGADGNINL